MTEIKENFCGACMAAPIAMVGSSVAISKKNKRNKRKSNKIFICTCVFITLLSIILTVYYLKTCNECR